MPPEALSNREVAAHFANVADLLQIRGDNIHRVLSYRRAAETIRELPRDLRAIAAAGELTALPHIGKTLAQKIEELLSTGRLEFLERLTAELPLSLVEVMRVGGVGPKKAALFWEQLQIATVAQLEEAARAGNLRDLPRMGAKSESQILAGIAALAKQGSEHDGRVPLGMALPAAQAILEEMLTLLQVTRGELAGSLRRARPTIGDVDILVASKAESAPIMRHFVALPQVARVLGQGPTKSAVELHNGARVDLLVIPPARWGTALCYFTGSKEHNIRLRNMALRQGSSLNEHALSPIDAEGLPRADAAPRLFAEEEMLYQALGLNWVPPELREDSGEIEAAAAGELPSLIQVSDIQSDLHLHTHWSDGTMTPPELAAAARALGLRCIAITDHSRSRANAGGLTIERLLQQQAIVRQLRADFDDLTILHGSEIDILADGRLDFPDDVLAELDFVIASLHSALRQERERVTARLVAAIRHPLVDCIGHPLAQQFADDGPGRPPVDADMDAVFAAAAESGVALEINANPVRLDLEARYARRAQELGIPLSINTDTHRPEQLHLMHFGIRTARRGWVEAANVLNCWPTARLLGWLRGRGRRLAGLG